MAITWIPTPNPALSLNPMINTSQGIGFIAGTDFVTISSGGVETPLFYLKNDTANKVSICTFTRKYFSLNADYAQFKHYAGPTVSDIGTPVTIHNLRENPAAPSSVMSASISPTVTDNGSLIAVVSADVLTETSTIPYIIDPGQSVLVTVIVQNDSDQVTTEWVWWELAI